MEPLARIFGSPARLRLLRLFLFNQDTAFTAETIAERAKLSVEIVRANLVDLTASGLLRKKAGTPVRYQVNGKFPQLDALDTFIRQTTNVRPADVITALKKTGATRLIILCGIFTGVVESQVDLLVVGDALSERVLATTVHALEAELGREIRYAAFATPDFRYRMGVYDRLIRDVLDYPHRVLLDKIGL